ncbi:archaetidylserine synthase [Candidatus Methanoperedens nitroreducens]|uniref:CDP-diacylglycerol--serine O-phosphatidyltransferase n=1 Tax=Candidatus Methanoperedens nitratireducens TaxID=1392998 RepID=A0A062VDS2_9EURY|nr:CDP-diacylglycerol--serine O-phosphatidyltransferase [Candidatus Methanoperedens nitroreducens]KCZ73360.1 archaetidylserine synthase [Candidatus Methanoperedens nitroreducens]MDJ1422691.1 CDP-diacylglycerol--serine O-phosphatidyltransferase [Candidatus Methanoperedens sp.]
MGENILRLIKPADLITLVNALLGFASLIMAVQGRITDALVLVLIAVIADGADGAFARYSGSGVLGANLDSLADVISFGVAPAVLAFIFLGSLGFLAWIFAGFFLVCGILRLARFNVAGKKDGFEGIPITAGGFIVALFLLWLNSWMSMAPGTVEAYVPYLEYMFILLLTLLSLLMVSTIGYPKLKNPFYLAPVLILLVVDIVFFYLDYTGIVIIASLLLLVLMFIYILSPVTRRFYDRDKRAGQSGV